MDEKAKTLMNTRDIAETLALLFGELVDGSSSKFWEVSQSGNTMTTRWGRIGSAGQSKTKTFADEQSAANAVAVLIEEKTDEGYVERSR